MADISEYTDAIMEARYGEEVRGSIVGALNKVNDDNNSYSDIKEEIESVYSDLTDYTEVTLLADAWSNGTQTVTVQGILADETKQIIEVVPEKETIDAYLASKVYCSGQAENSLTFKYAGDAPIINLKVFVLPRFMFGGTIDSVLDDNSTNPLQNKVIAQQFSNAAQAITQLTTEIYNLAQDNITNKGKIQTLENKEAEDKYNNIPVDRGTLGRAWTQYIKLTRYVWNNMGPFNWDNLITAETDGYLYISTTDRAKLRMTARLFPADFTVPGYLTPETGDAAVAMPSISIGAYNPDPMPGEVDVSVDSPSTACIFVRKGMKIGLFRDYDDGYSNTYCADGGSKPFFSNLANAIFYPLVESMEVEE